MSELEILQTAKDEKAYRWDAIRLIADQYGHDWDSLSFSDKPEPINATGLNKLIKEYQATKTIDNTSDDVTEPLEPKSAPLTLINQGVTVSPGQDDRQWYEYRRSDGSTFRSFDKLT